MKQSTLAFAVATAVAFAATSSIAAQGKGHGGGPKPKTTHSAQAPTQGSGSGKVKTTGAAKAQGPKTTGQTAKATGQGKVKTTVAAGETVTQGPQAKGTKKSSQVSTTGTLTPVQSKLTQNTNLANKLRTRLPGTDLLVASEGFRNLGQFVAAVNVSFNHDIPFADLKARMVTDGMSLGQAIKAERGDLDAITIAQKAGAEADALIAQTATSSKKPKR